MGASDLFVLTSTLVALRVEEETDDTSADNACFDTIHRRR